MTVLFGILGVASLLLFDALDARFCELFPSVRHCRPGFDACGLDCSHSWPLSKQIGAFLFFFGPSILFACTAARFGRRRRQLGAWLALLAGLVVLHAAIVLVLSPWT